MDISSTLLKNYSDSVAPDKRSAEDRIIYGTAYIDSNQNVFVYYDGSNIKTPVETSVYVETDDKVMVLLKNHTATIMGNLSRPTDNSAAYISSLYRYFNLSNLTAVDTTSVGYGVMDVVNRIIEIQFNCRFPNGSRTDTPLLLIPSTYAPHNNETYPITVFIDNDSCLQGYATVGTNGYISQSISNRCVGIVGSIKYKI